MRASAAIANHATGHAIYCRLHCDQGICVAGDPKCCSRQRCCRQRCMRHHKQWWFSTESDVQGWLWQQLHVLHALFWQLQRAQRRLLV